MDGSMNPLKIRVQEAQEKLSQFKPRIDSSDATRELDMWIKQNIPTLLNDLIPQLEE